MAERENYFILLELPFDPPVTDTAKINAAITAKQQQWSKDQTNPIKKVKASEYLAMLDDIKAVMLTESSRKNEAGAAKKIRDGKQKELNEKLMLYASKAEELSDKDMKLIMKGFGSYGFTEATVKQLFAKIVGEKNKDKVDLSSVIDKNQAKNIKNYMSQLDMKHGTLYEFLEISASASCSQLCEAAENLKKKILAKGEKTGSDNARQALCGLCAIIFKDKESKKKYDNYVGLTKYGELNDKIDEMALSNSRVIEPKMKEALVDAACSAHKITPSEASTYISNYCELMDYQEKDKSIVCGLCNTQNPVGTLICTNCGKPLVIICPECETSNSNAAKNCVKCGFDLTKMDRALELISNAKKLWNEKKQDEAEKALKEANLYWPKHPEILELEKTINDAKQKFKNTLAEINAAISEKKFYLAQLKISQAKSDGFVIGQDVETKVSGVINQVEAGIKKLDTLSGDSAFTFLVDLLDDISDSVELNKKIQQYPPEASGSISVTRTQGTCSFKWQASSSKGGIKYCLVRKQNAAPNSATDGEVIYSGNELSCSDSSLKKATVYHYALFVIRAGVSSKATYVSEPIVIVDNVTNVKTIGGDGIISLSWDKSATISEVRVGICKSNSQPQDLSSYQSVTNNRTDGIIIPNLQNGARYWISVSACHTVSGKAYPAEPIFVSSVPQKPADPIVGFNVQTLGETFHATWERAEWDVVLFSSPTKPTYTPKVVYNYEEFKKDYQPITLSLINMKEAEFSLNFIGQTYIIPGQINASNLILNDYYYISNVPMAEEPSFDINSSRTEIYVNFNWPKKMDKSLIVFRADDYPENYDDPLAKKVECNKRQYDTNGGVMITNAPMGKLYALIYIYFESAEQRIYSSPLKMIIQNEELRDVYYSFKYKKKGLFSKKRSLTLTIRSSGEFVLPAFCIIGKYKSVPLNRADGDIICSVSTDTDVNNSYTVEFEVDEIRPDTRIKMFLMNDKHYRFFKLLNEGESKI